MVARRIKISEAIHILSGMQNKNVYFTDILFEDGTVYFAPSKQPDIDMIIGDQILSTITFDDEEDLRKA